MRISRLLTSDWFVGITLGIIILALFWLLIPPLGKALERFWL